MLPIVQKKKLGLGFRELVLSLSIYHVGYIKERIYTKMYKINFKPIKFFISNYT